MNIYLRRFPGEVITPVITQPSAAACISSVAIADHRLINDGGSGAAPRPFLYAIELKAGCAVQPVDWQRFACEDDKVRDTIAGCIQDNLAQFVSLPNTDETDRMISNCLILALGDLQSIADLKSVACRFDGRRRLVEVRYETKNGTMHQVSIEQGNA